ncbi:MAG: hypothetical protein COV52_07440 [Gammaproteobacteria bacterium CG11_big_fil_rev_8_21_14_0_20_46_22]|nr:MAG: hypothetical protein COW05_06680 [Gammaproteobacteria bacterium CG12_big_fil_rev_8_21_14_0_65_46_12]PIR10716.1 MAG: hypothetical protein COV52_07440 [Gammaproteobacteria bacterium CG11_big_fil_rev_8_21_14_0_20_46_22]
MAKDYASQSRKKGKPKQSVRFSDSKKRRKSAPSANKKSTGLKLRWVLLLGFIVFIAAIIFLVSGERHPHKTSNTMATYAKGDKVTPKPSAGEKLTATSADTSETPARSMVNNIQFNFKPLPPAAQDDIKYYMLQLGSYREDSPDLKALRQQLHQLGIKYHLALNQRRKTRYYRLEVGPFHSSDHAQAAWQTLYDQHIYAIIRPVKRG